MVTNLSSPTEKIACFRSLFRGRTDVYPRRFESRRTGRSGYQPACGNEWVRGICEKPRIKCSECPYQSWLPVADDTVRWHLEGRDALGQPFVMGVYPMLLDETCWFLALDFDGDGWKEDVKAFRASCSERAIPCALERSRSGNGAHLWLFFDEAIPAVLARKLGALLLTEAMERRPEIGLSSYDRLFPNQDTLPKGGFGNLIALPLQKAAREHGHTLFLGEKLEPLPDQWAYLSRLGRISRARVEDLVDVAEKNGRVIGVRVVPEDDFASNPWQAPPSRTKKLPITGPLPDAVTAVLSDQVYLPKTSLSPPIRNRLIRMAAFQNPEFYRAQAMRLPTFDKPRVIGCAEDFPEHLALPRGCMEEIATLFRSLGIEFHIDDQRQGGSAIDAKFQGDLRPRQREAVQAMASHETGVLAATTAFGKTVVAAWLIAQRGVNTLILVHRQQLMEQWVERLSTFLGIQPKQIGRLGGGRRKLRGTIDVALLQSVVRKDAVDDRVANYGHVIVDECHHLPARSFELIMRRARARFVIGLSATVVRKDGHHPIVFMQCGPVRYRVDAKGQAAQRPFVHNVIVRPTGFRPAGDPDPDVRFEFQRLCDEMMRDDRRNELICADLAESLREGRYPLVLTERTEHLDLLAARIAQHPNMGEDRVIALRGAMGKRRLAAAMSALRDPSRDGSRVVLATGRFVGEGFDDPKLDTLFVTMPLSWRGTVAQYVGRLHRLWDGKLEVRVYDYADLDIPMLSRMFDRRCAGYEAAGYSIYVPASALPGWPQEVPLPVSPDWKRDYAASVRRLLRDGIHADLARLFANAAREISASDGTSNRARSASEAFLFQRLESLPQTAGQFRLNAELPISFCQRGVMEVDFVCEERRLAIEIDGAQHLGDVDAWRRDRRKDALLEQHGYFVMRFLAADIGKRLDEVLDSIMAVMAMRERQNRGQRGGPSRALVAECQPIFRRAVGLSQLLCDPDVKSLHRNAAPSSSIESDTAG